jgi:hypothetical protein
MWFRIISRQPHNIGVEEREVLFVRPLTGEYERSTLPCSPFGEGRERRIDSAAGRHDRKLRRRGSAVAGASGFKFIAGERHLISLGHRGGRRHQHPVTRGADRSEDCLVSRPAETVADTVESGSAVEAGDHVAHHPWPTGRWRSIVGQIEAEWVDGVEWGRKKLAHRSRPYRSGLSTAIWAICGKPRSFPPGIHMRSPFRPHASARRVPPAVRYGSPGWWWQAFRSESNRSLGAPHLGGVGRTTPMVSPSYPGRSVRTACFCPSVSPVSPLRREPARGART